MGDIFKNLKKKSDRNLFSNLRFTEDHKRKIRQSIRENFYNDNTSLLMIIELLVHKKEVNELENALQKRGVFKFKNNKESLYNILQELELNGIVASSQEGNYSDRLYFLTKKGQGLSNEFER